MKKLGLVFAACWMLMSTAMAGTDTPWKTIKIAEGAFSFQMPAAPKLVKREGDSPVTAHVLATGDGVLMAGYSDPLPFNVDANGAKRLLDDFEEGMSGEAKLKSAGKRDATFQGRPGRILLFQGPQGEFWRVAAVVNGDRIVFQLFIGEKDKLASPSVAKFFNSLKF